MTAKEKLVAMVGSEKAEQYVDMVQAMVQAENQVEQVEEKVLSADV